MDQQDLIAKISAHLKGLSEVGGAYLGGSHGRDEADGYSDIDLYVVVADSDIVQETLKQLADSVAEIVPILHSKVLPNARTINCITEDWQRFDLTVVTGLELGFLAGGQVKPLFDDLGISDALVSATPAIRQPTADALLEDVNEFIRILGLSAVVKGRDDLVVAQTGTNLMRDILIRTMVLENSPQPQRGVLALGRSLTSDQHAELRDLPAADGNWSAIDVRTKAIAGSFFPRARQLAVRLGADWPERFETITRKYLAEKIGMKI